MKKEKNILAESSEFCQYDCDRTNINLPYGNDQETAIEKHSLDEDVSLDEEESLSDNESLNYNEPIDDDDSLDAAIDRFIASQLSQGAECDEYDEEETYEGKTFEEDADNDIWIKHEAETEGNSFISLNHLTGLKSVKEKLTTYERVVRFNKLRAENGLPVTSSPLHAMFLGSPGTGKTTVAKMMGMMLRRCGVLSRGHVVVRERATLLGQNYNSESEKTLAAIEEAKGGILFIDEAYQLYQAEDPRDPGKFVIETLLTSLADESNRDWMLVLAGYPNEMKRMLDMNPGFKSRIPASNIYTFEDFTESELMEIAEKYLERNCYTMNAEAHEALAMRLKEDYAQRDKNFGNARHVLNLIQTEILPAMAVRVINEGLCDEISLTEVLKTDIPAFNPKTLSTYRRPGFAV